MALHNCSVNKEEKKTNRHREEITPYGLGWCLLFSRHSPSSWLSSIICKSFLWCLSQGTRELDSNSSEVAYFCPYINGLKHFKLKRLSKKVRHSGSWWAHDQRDIQVLFLNVSERALCINHQIFSFFQIWADWLEFCIFWSSDCAWNCNIIFGTEKPCSCGQIIKVSIKTIIENLYRSQSPLGFFDQET